MKTGIQKTPCLWYDSCRNIFSFRPSTQNIMLL